LGGPARMALGRNMFIQRASQLHHVQIDGLEGGEVVVFANSLGTDLRIWDEVVKPLTGSLRTIRYDMRGHGLTSPTEPPYSIADLAADLEALIDALKVPRMTICGISVGGQVALQVAHNRPQQVQGLILCDTSYRIGAPDMWMQRIAAVTDGGLPAISDAVISRWFSDTYRARNAGDAAGYKYMLERCTVAGYAGVCAALRDADLEAAARGIRCPTLVLCGDQDQATPPQLNRALAEAIPGALFQLIPGAGHLPCLEQPDILSAQVASFVGNHAHV
jgi:3-oxoadipate enol-lactonase